ncbi:MAG: ATP-binding cassette domain-containing protein [Clostridiales Family XIII bacterium]|jgi:ABC-2 type transport system ATP-binding protein|nr:ATP-binding cassette domain-containing protein [Clostridiales Family XIII bacterium]
MTSIIQADNLIKTFGNKEVIRNCSLSVKKGEIYGFLGANGAGKTTVLKLICGLLRPTAGTIEVAGIDAVQSREAVLAKIGSIIEVPVFYEHLSAAENLRIHLAYLGLAGKADIEDALERVGLPNTENQKVATFSLGMRQRLGIARAIIHRPEILLLDEPINGLDPAGIREVRELLRSLSRNDGVTIMISSHIISEIEHIADTVGIIANGTMMRETPVSALHAERPNGLEDYLIELMSGGKTYA